LPTWLSDSYERIISLLKWGFHFSYRNTQMAKLTSGGILNDMRNNFVKKITKNTQNELYLYSGV
jgi:hypothetical protein